MQAMLLTMLFYTHFISCGLEKKENMFLTTSGENMMVTVTIRHCQNHL